MALQVHESVGHPTELDRVYGTEAAYAGTSFLAPGDLGSAALRLRAHERHRRRDDAAAGSARSASTTRACRPRASRSSRAACSRGSSPRARRRRGSARARRLDARRRLEPDAARADDEPPPRARRGLARGADRRRRRRASTSRRTRAGRSTTSGSTSSSGRRSRGRSRAAGSGGCCATRRTPGSRRVFWGSLDAVAGPEEWRLHGLTNCGKGQPGQNAHVSHGASPARFRGVQVGVAGVSDALELAERALAAAAGDEAEAVVQSERSGFARFAGSEVHQPTLVDEHVVGAARRARTARAASRRRTGRDGEGSPSSRGARSRRPTARRRTRDFPGSRSRRRCRTVDGFDEETASLGPDEQARLGGRGDRRAPAASTLYGYFTSGVDRARGRARHGVAARQRLTDATRARASPRGDGASGYAERTAVARRRGRSGRGRAREAAAKAERTRGAQRARAGHVPRGPRAVRDRGAARATSPRTASAGSALLEERSYLTGRLGERLFDRSVSITDDALDPRGLPKAFDFEGTPKRRVALVEDGRRARASSGTARRRPARARTESTGHAPARLAGARTGRCRRALASPAARPASTDELAERSATAST